MRNILFVLVITAACGGKSTPESTGPATPVVTSSDGSAADTAVPVPAPEPEKAPEPAQPPQPPPPPEPDAFMKLSRDEKVKIMKTKVMPAMAKAFKAHDPKEFPKLTCKTCHGKGAGDDSYKMPNPDLEKLDFAAIKEGKQHPKTVAFMEKVVKPEMAKLLGIAEYDEKNPNGFGCLTCHTLKP